MEFLRTTYGKVAAAAVAFVLVAILCVSCSRPAYQPVYAGVPAVGGTQVVQPAVVAAPAVVGAPVVVQGHSGAGDFLAGALVGSALSGRNSTHTTVVTSTAPAQQYGQRPQAQRYVPPTTTTQTVTNPRGVTTTTTSRPSTFGSTTRQSVSVGRPRSR